MMYFSISSRYGFVLLVLSCWLTAGCQTDPDRIDVAPALRPLYAEPLLAVGDQIQIRVFRHPDLSQALTVPDAGVIHYPLIGEVQVAGISVAQLRQILTDKLNKFVVNPQVDVRVTLRLSQRVVVLGEVRTPSVITMNNPMRAVEVVGRAGGFNVEATKAHVILIREEDGKSVRRILDMKKAITMGEMAHNPQIQAGDILYIPPSTVTNLDRAARHLSTWLSPLRQIQDSILVGYAIRDVIDDTPDVTQQIIVTTP